VLMISAKAEEELFVIAKEAGADGFICKPLLPQVLLPQIRALLLLEKEKRLPLEGQPFC
jgi:DNA-binding response OmpR family regulator